MDTIGEVDDHIRQRHNGDRPNVPAWKYGNTYAAKIHLSSQCQSGNARRSHSRPSKLGQDDFRQLCKRCGTPQSAPDEVRNGVADLMLLAATDELRQSYRSTATHYALAHQRHRVTELLRAAESWGADRTTSAALMRFVSADTSSVGPLEVGTMLVIAAGIKKAAPGTVLPLSADVLHVLGMNTYDVGNAIELAAHSASTSSLTFEAALRLAFEARTPAEAKISLIPDVFRFCREDFTSSNEWLHAEWVAAVEEAQEELISFALAEMGRQVAHPLMASIVVYETNNVYDDLAAEVGLCPSSFRYGSARRVLLVPLALEMFLHRSGEPANTALVQVYGPEVSDALHERADDVVRIAATLLADNPALVPSEAISTAALVPA